MKTFEKYREQELQSEFSDFSISEILYTAINNDFWQDKTALWTIISGACEEAGKKYYVALNEYIQNLCDIDTCNIHALVSMAKSVDAEHLVEFINTDYPTELNRLINLFSIPRSTLLYRFGMLNLDSVTPIYGFIDFRNNLNGLTPSTPWYKTDSLVSNVLSGVASSAKPQNYYIEIVQDIINNADKLLKLAQANNININDSISKVFKDAKTTNPAAIEIIKTLELEDKDGILVNSKFDLSLIEVFEKIKKISQSQTNLTSDDYLKKLKLYSVPRLLIDIDPDEDRAEIDLNYIYVIINLFKTYCMQYNEESGSYKFINTEYYDAITNTNVNMFVLFCKMTETIQMYDTAFIQDFVCFHFYGLFYDMIINDSLKNEWGWINQDNNLNIANYISKIGEYTFDGFKDKIKNYLTETQIEMFLNNSDKVSINDNEEQLTAKITNYKQVHIDFIQFLSILNNSLPESENYDYIVTNFNNPFDINANYNSEKRRLMKDILKISEVFCNICLKISYARENIKSLIQQYSFIGTNKIITEVTRDYFLKNFGNNADWRLLDTEGELNLERVSMNNLNGQSTSGGFFNVNLIEYYDNTAYFNILSDLPSCIVGYEVSGQIPKVSSFINTTDYISTWVIEGSGLVSTITDTFNFSIPQNLIPNNNEEITFASGELSGQTVDIQVWNDNTASSIFIPPGTEVSGIIPPGNFITVTSWVDNEIPVTGLCASFVHDYNNRFWERDFSNADVDLQNKIILDEISYYENFFEDLKNCSSLEEKYEIYRDKIYPLLTDVWNMSATSGFLSNPILSGMQFAYSGEYPGQFLTRNIANKTFTTIAPIQSIGNLIPVTAKNTEESLYLAKPFYEMIAYYINLMTKEILNMQNKNKLGQGIPIDGWKQSYIEFRGYNTTYENSSNKIEMSLTPSAIFDVDGPWVYTGLQKFIKLYYDNAFQIPFEKIQKFVNENYITVNNKIKKNIAIQLHAFQHKIYRKRKDRIFDFQLDDFGNQYILYKNNDYNSFDNAGEIWVRPKNYTLAVPLMLNTIIPDGNGNTDAASLANNYINDVFDTLQCNQQINYANMFKQLFNNAIQFGVVKNTIWVLGYTNYTSIDYTLNKGQVYRLKLVCVQFNQNTNLNTLTIDTTSLQTFSVNADNDYLTQINEFVGTYLNEKTGSLDFILYNKDALQLNATDIVNKNNINKLTDLTLTFKLFKYSFNNPAFKNPKEISIDSAIHPAFNLLAEKCLFDTEANDLAIYNNGQFEDLNQFVGANVTFQYLDTPTIIHTILDSEIEGTITNGPLNGTIISALIPAKDIERKTFEVKDITLSGEFGDINNLTDYSLNIDLSGIVTEDKILSACITNISNNIKDDISASFFEDIDINGLYNDLNDVIITGDIDYITETKANVIFEVSGNMVLDETDYSRYTISNFCFKNYSNDKNYDNISSVIINGNISSLIKLNSENNTLLSNVSASIENGLVDINISPNLSTESTNGKLSINYAVLSSSIDGITENAESLNVWRVSHANDYIQIAYEAINPNNTERDDIKTYVDTCILGVTDSATYYTTELVIKYKLENMLIDNTNSVYNTFFTGINASLNPVNTYIKNINDINSIRMFHERYPDSYLDNDNVLTFKTIISNLGGNKTIFSERIDSPAASGLLNILTGSFVSISNKELDTNSGIINEVSAQFNNIISTGQFFNPDYNTVVQLSAGLDDMKNIFSNNGLKLNISETVSAIYADELVNNKISTEQLTGEIKSVTNTIIPKPPKDNNPYEWQLDFDALLLSANNTFKEIETNEDLNLMNLYNTSVQSLNTISNFIPAMTTCLYEPLKITFNTGSIAPDIQTVGNETFDIDVKVYIDDNFERNKAVGWRCGYIQTSYLNWLSRDVTDGNSEIVLVDVEKYKTYNYNRLFNELKTDDIYMDVIINACWFNETQLSSLNPFIEICWKGTYLKFPLKELIFNMNCCNSPVLKLHINLTKNIINIEKIVSLNILKEFNHIYYFGKLNIFESDYNSLINNNITSFTMNNAKYDIIPDENVDSVLDSFRTPINIITDEAINLVNVAENISNIKYYIQYKNQLFKK